MLFRSAFEPNDIELFFFHSALNKKAERKVVAFGFYFKIVSRTSVRELNIHGLKSVIQFMPKIVPFPLLWQ